MPKISPCLWFDTQAQEAVQFYTTLFAHSRVTNTTPAKQQEGSELTLEFELAGWALRAQNGSSGHQFTPALSLFVYCADEREIDHLWQALSQGGQTRMALAAYPWASKYGWTVDRFGVDWQLMLGAPGKQKIVPAFLFVDAAFGKGQEALGFYTALFPQGRVDNINLDPNSNTVAHSSFTLDGSNFVLMEGAGRHNFAFTPAFSFVVECKDQKEIDYYRDRLTQDGKPQAKGWLSDRFGVTWQIVGKP